MKVKLLLLLFLPVLIFSSFTPAKNGKLTISYKATGTIEGYSHLSKMKVYVDETLVGESPEKDQQATNSFSVSVPKGAHKVKCQLWAFLGGKWEERTEANEYSFDWSYEENMTLGKKNKLAIVFDITDEKVIKK
jgi:hypothetical protein